MLGTFHPSSKYVNASYYQEGDIIYVINWDSGISTTVYYIEPHFISRSFEVF